MKRIITDLHFVRAGTPGGPAARMLWFVALWGASVIVVAGVAYGLRKIILG